MRYITETVEDSQKALFIFNEPSPFIAALQKNIESYNINVVSKTHFPSSTENYGYIFIFVQDIVHNTLQKIYDQGKKTIVITHDVRIFRTIQNYVHKNSIKNVKIINIDSYDHHSDSIDRVLWFALSQSKEKSLNLEKGIKPESKLRKKDPISFSFTRRKIVALTVFLFLCSQLFFILPLGITAVYTITAARDLQSQKLDHAREKIVSGKKYLSFAQTSYLFAQPIYRFLFIALIPENIMSLESNSLKMMETAIEATQNANSISSLILNTNKSPKEMLDTRNRILELKKQVVILTETSEFLRDNLDYNIDSIKKIRHKAEDINDQLKTAGKLVNHLDTLFANNSEKKYILFLYNNMEIRPGGGFLGSFAVVTFKNLTLSDFQIFDVYDADGQLKAHVEPPKAIREILEQPHWFLRDSNFNPDFEQNVKTAEFFLEKELNLTNFDGSIGLTTTAVAYMLDAFGNIYIPDSNDVINKNNFYYKTQLNTEKDFFPGSTRKKNYLSLIARTLFLKMQEASPIKLALAIEKSLEEKHLVIYMKDKVLQKDIRALGWDGKVVAPRCVSLIQQCVVNHIFPIDANLGINKVNYFVSRFFTLRTTISRDGAIVNSLNASFNNASSSGESPGGTYRNYFQTYVPAESTVTSVKFNGRNVSSYDENDSGAFKIVGTFIEIPPKSSGYVTVEYTLNNMLKKGLNALQIVIQKQIGTANSEFSFEIYLPPNILVTDQNFSSLAKNNTVVYNTNLSTDRIFVIELVKE